MNETQNHRRGKSITIYEYIHMYVFCHLLYWKTGKIEIIAKLTLP